MSLFANILHDFILGKCLVKNKTKQKKLNFDYL